MGENLYHFTSSKALISILESNTFQISKIKKMNDINEISDFELVRSDGDKLRLKESCLRTVNKVFNDDIDTVKRDSEDLEKIINALNQYFIEYSREVEIWNEIFSKCYVGCFTMGNGNEELLEINSIARKSSMWGYYGQKHEGVCIIFDKEKLDFLFNRNFNGDKLIKGKIKYDDSSENPLEWEDTIKRIKSRFFIKDSSWEKENEYRYLVKMNQDIDDFLKVDNIIFAVKGIILGTRIDDSMYQEILRKLTKYRVGIKLYQSIRTFYNNSCDIVILGKI